MAALRASSATSALARSNSPHFSHTYLSPCLAEMGAFCRGWPSAQPGGTLRRPSILPALCLPSSVGVLYLRQGDLHQALPLLERPGICGDGSVFFLHGGQPRRSVRHVGVLMIVRLLERALGRPPQAVPRLSECSALHPGRGASARRPPEEAYTLAARALDMPVPTRNEGMKRVWRPPRRHCHPAQPLEPKPA
jgi:hypothetical protein